MWINNLFGNIPIENLSQRKLAKFENDMEFIATVNRLVNVALDRFKWQGLPDTVDERFLERCLLLTGKAVLVKMNDNYINLAFTTGGNINVYGEPLRGYGYGLNGWNEELEMYINGMDDTKLVLDGVAGTEKQNFDAVLCRDNAVMFPYFNYILLSARRMTRLKRIMDVTAQNLKQPVIITCDESMVNSVKETLNRRDDNVTAIISSGKLPIETFNVWDTKAKPETLTVLWEQYERLENEIRETLGINSLQQSDKKERLIVDEVNANNEVTQDNIDCRLKERKLFCDKVNKAFGLNISVEVKDNERNVAATQNKNVAATPKEGVK